jgi:uncharacterized membrane protein
MQTSIIQNIFRILLGTFLVIAGISHLTWSREEFTAQVPNWVSLSNDAVVIISGIIEILLGSALVFIKKYRLQIGWIAATFFILVFPGNIAQYINRIDAFGLDSDLKRGIRLLFQPVLILWALWSTGAWKVWQKRNS